MSDFSLELDGVEAQLDDINSELDNLQTAVDYTVGTGVEYSIYLELGTSKMDAKPFFGPALDEVRAKGVDGFLAENTRTTVEQLDTVKQVLENLAFALERRIKEIITDKGLIDTGTLRASVVAIPGGDPSKLPDASEFSGFDSDNPAPPNAGRGLVETIEVDT